MVRHRINNLIEKSFIGIKEAGNCRPLFTDDSTG